MSYTCDESPQHSSSSLWTARKSNESGRKGKHRAKAKNTIQNIDKRQFLVALHLLNFKRLLVCIFENLQWANYWSLCISSYDLFFPLYRWKNWSLETKELCNIPKGHRLLGGYCQDWLNLWTTMWPWQFIHGCVFLLHHNCVTSSPNRHSNEKTILQRKNKRWADLSLFPLLQILGSFCSWSSGGRWSKFRGLVLS